MKTRVSPHKPTRRFTPILAVGFGLLLLVLIEFTCRMLGLGKEDPYNDPFVSFSQVEPLFALNPLTNRYELRPERRFYFVNGGFHRKKAENTFRIFVFGGSTVQGRPYSIETAFPDWLRINLELAFPGRKFEAINCGGISYASYRLIPIIRECLNYQPDLFIVCTGQNEFLEARTYGSLKNWAKPLSGLTKAAHSLASYRALDNWYTTLRNNKPGKISARKPTLKMEVDALLDYSRGLEAYHRDPEWRRGVEAHFRENIRRILSISEKSNVPLVILNPPVNLKDCPPFKSEHNRNISKEQKEAYDDWLHQANALYQTNLEKASQYLRWATELDPEYAQTHYSLGQCYLALRQYGQAEQSFRTALIEDVCPLRITPAMRTFIHDFCHNQQIPYLDVQALLLEHSESPVLGGEILVDHIHPSIRGHQLIAESLARLLFNTYLEMPADPEWETHRAEAYAQHLESLDELYYVHAQIRLDNLNAWAAGRADGPPIEIHQPIEPN